jgi:hypothetical protein
MFKRIIAASLCLLIAIPAFAADPVYKVKYDGGSVSDMKSGTGITMSVSSTTIKFFKDKQEIASVPATAITEISYGQDVHRRVGSAVAVGAVTLGVGALMALSKSKKHFIGLTWVDGDKKGGLAMQCDKNEYRGILAGLEGVTGKKAVDSEAMTVKN